MKFQIDLLPKEYKSLPRDFLGIVLGVAAIIICVSWTTSIYWRSFNLEAGLQKKIDAKHDELSEMNKTISNLHPDMTKINYLNNSIQFINTHLNTPGTSWVDFLFALESTVPDQVYIQDISPKNLNDTAKAFTLKGEAASIKEVLAFVKQMQQNDAFPNVFLQGNSTHLVGENSVTQFSLTFNYKRK